MQAIVCRDCFAPPGKLKIVIHSTKDGPAVHTVKKGSSLEGHIFPGDLIISVDNVDTRSYTAEQVMKIMTTKTRFERKITVLHFEDESTGMV
jgi:C-terminal processing protease CtpA/Prc